jgi:hypothetical protein
VAPTVDSIPRELGEPEAAALDTGYFSATNIVLLKERGIEPYIATGRESHNQSWQERFAAELAPPPEDASPKVMGWTPLFGQSGRGFEARLPSLPIA